MNAVSAFIEGYSGYTVRTYSHRMTAEEVATDDAVDDDGAGPVELDGDLYGWDR